MKFKKIKFQFRLAIKGLHKFVVNLESMFFDYRQDENAPYLDGSLIF